MNDTAQGAQYRLLIIDDNHAIHDDIRKILTVRTDTATLNVLKAELFEERGRPTATTLFTIDSAYQGQEALERVRRALQEGQPYQVAFVDVRMPPSWDGIETIQHLWGEDPNLQCVICSAYSDYSWDEVMEKLGESDQLLILKKPFDPIEIIQIAHALSRKWVLHKQVEDEIKGYVTERKATKEQIQFLAYYDALTELPNRTLLYDRLTVSLARAHRHQKKVALLFLDLDHFKTINDSLGHSVGDLLLKGVAERLKRWTREEDSVARLGGDEFLVMLPDLETVADAARSAERIVNAMAEVFVIQDDLLNITCSIGISIFPDHGTDIEALIKNADMAMYSAKEHGRNSFQFFTQDLNSRAMERWALENSLRGALERKELFLVYQPQVDIVTRALTGVEALIRWQHPGMGLVPPCKFIPVAEDSGLIVPIGEWMLKTACTQARQWQEKELPAVSIAVNISALQFRQKGFLNSIKTVLRETGLAPQYLELELTESLLISNADVIIVLLEELKEMGLKLSIDDFGTGYSSLSYLTRLPLHKLKIDRSFVRDITTNPNDALITSAIISMAKSLNIKVIAEGVENEEQLAFLQARQCNEIQGYYVSKPLPAHEIAQKL